MPPPGLGNEGSCETVAETQAFEEQMLPSVLMMSVEGEWPHGLEVQTSGSWEQALAGCWYL